MFDTINDKDSEFDEETFKCKTISVNLTVNIVES